MPSLIPVGVGCGIEFKWIITVATKPPPTVAFEFGLKKEVSQKLTPTAMQVQKLFEPVYVWLCIHRPEVLGSFFPRALPNR